jgi:hypothetical protein
MKQILESDFEANPRFQSAAVHVDAFMKVA